MEITYAISTFEGNREHNEDYAAVGGGDESYCFAVADGLGGHGKGEVASKLVCDTAILFFSENREEALGSLFELAQERLLDRQKQENALDAMKTTLNLLIVDEASIRWGHVGDSRTYYFRKGRIAVRTKDHSVPQMMVTMGEIKEKDIRHHADRNRLLRVMGVEWTKPQYVLEKEIRTGRSQAFLLCTDGFWEFIEDREMEKCLKKAKDARSWLDAMNEIVCRNGKGHDMDNYTALAVWVN